MGNPIPLWKFKPSVVHFGMPMGLFGVGFSCYQLSYSLHPALHSIALGIMGLAWLVLLLLGLLSLVSVFERVAVRNSSFYTEWSDAFTISLFPSITLTLMLALLSLSLFKLPLDHAWFRTLFFLIVGLHFYLNLALLKRWLFTANFSLHHHKPTWFIMLSGNFVAVISGAQLSADLNLHHSVLWYELMWLLFSGALLIWLAFVVSLFYRLIFHTPIETHLRPSQFIFLAPPSLATVAFIQLINMPLTAGLHVTGGLIWLLFGFATAMLLVFASGLRHFSESGISLAGWAYVYPLAAYALAAQYLAQWRQVPWLHEVAIGLLAGVLVLIVLLFWSGLKARLNS